MRIRDNVYDITPEIYKALSYTGYTGKSMKRASDVLMMNIIINDLGYTGVGDKKSNRKSFLTITLPKLVDEIQNRTFEEITDDSNDLQGEGEKL